MGEAVGNFSSETLRGPKTDSVLFVKNTNLI